jgi:hypothetical protein
MANKKISGYDQVSSINGPELLEVVQDGANMSATAEQIIDLAADRTTVNTASSIEFNMGGKRHRVFAGTQPVDGARSWSVINGSKAVSLIGLLEIETGAPQTFSANDKILGSENILMDVSSKVWTPSVGGFFRVSGENDGTDWWWTIVGPSL